MGHTARVTRATAAVMRLPLALIVITAGLLVRLPRLFLITLWADEYHTIRVLRLPLASIVAGDYIDLNPPLYFLLLLGYSQLVGGAEIALRSFSLIFATLSLLLTFLIGLELWRSRLAAAAATSILAFNPLWIYYATEIRSYALLGFLSLLSLLSYLRMRHGSRPTLGWAMLLALSIAACGYTHHFGLLTAGVVGIFGLVDLASAERRRWAIRGLSATVGGLILYTPGLLLVKQRLEELSPPDAASRIPISDIFTIFTLSFHHPWYEPLMIVVATLALAVGLVSALAEPTTRRAALALGLALAACAGVAVAANLAQINISRRYLLHVASLSFILLGATMLPEGAGWRRLARLVGALAIGLYLIYGLDFAAHYGQENRIALFKADWRAVSQVIAAQSLPDEPYVIMGWDATPVQYYLGKSAINSTQLNSELATNARPSYLIVMSRYGLTPPNLAQAELIYEDPVAAVRLLRLRTR